MCTFAPSFKTIHVMLLNDSAQVMRKNTSGSLTPSAIPSGSDPFLSKQLQEKMRQPLWYPMRVAYDKSDRVLQIHKHLDQKGIENFLPMKAVDKLLKLIEEDKAKN